MGPDGTLYVATGDGELVALEQGTLTVKSSYKAGKAFTSSPVVFEYKDKDLIAVATRDGQIQSARHRRDGRPAAGKNTGLFKPGLCSGRVGQLAGLRWHTLATGAGRRLCRRSRGIRLPATATSKTVQLLHSRS